MKKILLTAVALLTTVVSVFADKTVTVDLTTPATYGYTVPADASGTTLNTGDKITCGDIVITAISTSGTSVRFWSTNGDITFRLASGGEITVEAGGANIKKIEFSGSNLATTNLKADPGTYTDKLWEGNSPKIQFTRIEKTIQIKTITITYEAAGGETPEAEKYSACSTEITDWQETTNDDGSKSYSCTATTSAADVFANATSTDGHSYVNFGTANIDVVAVGGSNPQDIIGGTPGGAFPGWKEWFPVEWKVKNTNLDDKKTTYFDWIEGTGNPYTELGAEEVTTDGVATGNFRPTYKFYEADGSNGMPVNGLYYKFTPKTDGILKVRVWSNKGNRNTFFVDEATQKPIAYTAEGYINGQNETLDDGTTRKKFLTAEEIKAIHDGAKVVGGVDNAPYVIGAGNQLFWGWITVNVKANGTYWLFQHSSQIGFGGYEFNAVPTGIENVTVSTETKTAPRKMIKNNKLVIVNGNATYNVAGQLIK